MLVSLLSVLFSVLILEESNFGMQTTLGVYGWVCSFLCLLLSITSPPLTDPLNIYYIMWEGRLPSSKTTK